MGVCVSLSFSVCCVSRLIRPRRDRFIFFPLFDMHPFIEGAVIFLPSICATTALFGGGGDFSLLFHCALSFFQEEGLLLLPIVEAMMLTDGRVLDVLHSGRPKPTTVLPHVRSHSEQLQCLLRLTKVMNHSIPDVVDDDPFVTRRPRLCRVPVMYAIEPLQEFDSSLYVPLLLRKMSQTRRGRERGKACVCDGR